MTEKALYKQLAKFNSKIENSYNSNWGSLLTFVDSKDTKFLMDKSNKIQDQMALAKKSGLAATSAIEIRERGSYNFQVRKTEALYSKNQSRRYHDQGLSARHGAVNASQAIKSREFVAAQPSGGLTFPDTIREITTRQIKKPESTTRN